MTTYALRLLEDHAQPGSRFSGSLEGGHRILYVVEGEVTVSAGQRSQKVPANSAWYGAGSCSIHSGAEGARLWRWELVRAPASNEGLAAGESVVSTRKLSHDVILDPQSKYLIRCDRVDFPLGGVAYTHTHQGPGIRCLLRGGFRVDVGGKTSVIGPGEPWFEKGPEPVCAAASEREPTSFVRVMILPATLKGKSSIRYVNPEDRDKPKLQQYRVFLDEFMEI
ncbi:MAG: hypothetical protein ACE5JS_08330 [Nitrospinota bacterium]